MIGIVCVEQKKLLSLREINDVHTVMSKIPEYKVLFVFSPNFFNLFKARLRSLREDVREINGRMESMKKHASVMKAKAQEGML